MKSEKGITLISLTVYIIVLTMVLGIMTVLSGYFFKSINEVNDTNPLTEFSKFNSFFIEQINRKGIKVLKCETQGQNSYILFDDGVQYTFNAKNKGIYKNKVKICRNIDQCIFTIEENKGKTNINVKYKSENLEKNISYRLK